MLSMLMMLMLATSSTMTPIAREFDSDDNDVYNAVDIADVLEPKFADTVKFSDADATRPATTAVGLLVTTISPPTTSSSSRSSSSLRSSSSSRSSSSLRSSSSSRSSSSRSSSSLRSSSSSSGDCACPACNTKIQAENLKKANPNDSFRCQVQQSADQCIAQTCPQCKPPPPSCDACNCKKPGECPHEDSCIDIDGCQPENQCGCPGANMSPGSPCNPTPPPSPPASPPPEYPSSSSDSSSSETSPDSPSPSPPPESPSSSSSDSSSSTSMSSPGCYSPPSVSPPAPPTSPPDICGDKKGTECTMCQSGKVATSGYFGGCAIASYVGKWLGGSGSCLCTDCRGDGMGVTHIC